LPKKYHMKQLVLFILVGMVLLSSCQNSDKTNTENAGVKETGVNVTINENNEAVIVIPDETAGEKPIPIGLARDTIIPSGNDNDLTPEEKERRLELRRAKTAFNNGMQYYQEGNYPEAINAFKMVLQMDETNDKAFFNLGKIYAMQGQPELSLSYYEDAVRLNPNDSASWLGIGMIYYNRGDFENALKYYNRSIEAGPGYALAYYNRGTVAGQSKNYAESIADLTTAIRLDPNSDQAYMNRGLAYYYSKQTDKACLDWNKAAELGNPEAIKAVSLYCTDKK